MGTKRSSSPISLNTVKGIDKLPSRHRWSPRFEKSEVKACNTQSPRYVTTDSSQDKDVVYTDSLVACLGVLLYEDSGNKSIAGLAHILPHRKDIKNREERVLEKMIKELDSNYRPSKLNAVIAVGDDVDPDTFHNTVNILIQQPNISKNRLEFVYGSSGQPHFITNKGKGMNSTKIAYDTQNQDLNIGKE